MNKKLLSKTKKQSEGTVFAGDSGVKKNIFIYIVTPRLFANPRKWGKGNKLFSNMHSI